MSDSSAPSPRAADILPARGRVPDDIIREGRYEVRWARTAEELDAALRLRYEVFNLELGEGLETSHISGRDTDAFDATNHHMLVVDTRKDTVVGTYRMQTREMAEHGAGFYCDDEFDLSVLSDTVLDESIEVGRACIHRDHRKQRVLFTLWKGLASYLRANGKFSLFGCCSLTSQDPHEGLAVMRHLRDHGHVHDGPLAPTRPELACVVEGEPRDVQVKIPTLFATYLRFGGQVLSEPAIDRRFKTIDYLVLLDVRNFDPFTRKLFGTP